MIDSIHTDTTRLRSLKGRHAAIASAFLRGLCGEARPSAVARAPGMVAWALAGEDAVVRGAFGEAALAADAALERQEAGK